MYNSNNNNNNNLIIGYDSKRVMRFIDVILIYRLSRFLAVADRQDCQGVSPMDIVTSRKLNYCNLVFTSYQRYRDRLANMQATLGGAADEKRDENEKLQDEKNIVEQIEEPDEDYGIERVVDPVDRGYCLPSSLRN